MTDYPVGDTVVLQAKYYNESDQLIDPESTPTCEVHDSRGRAIQTNIPVTRVATGTFQADFVTTGLSKGSYKYLFVTTFEGKPSVRDGDFTLKSV
jgi:hypothetical protein